MPEVFSSGNWGQVFVPYARRTQVFRPRCMCLVHIRGSVSQAQGMGWFWLFYCYIFSQNAGWNMWESARHCIYLDMLIDGKIHISRHNWFALNKNLSWHNVTLSKVVVNKMVHSTKEKEEFIHNFWERGCHQDAGLHPLNGSPSLHPSPALIDHPPLTTTTTLHSQLCTHWQHGSIHQPC